MLFRHKVIYTLFPIMQQCNKKLFYNLHQLATFKSRNLSNLRKGNLYRFYFVTENNKYVLIHGLVIKASNTMINFASLGRRLFVYTIISNVYIYFHLSMDLPSISF